MLTTMAMIADRQKDKDDGAAGGGMGGVGGMGYSFPALGSWKYRGVPGRPGAPCS